MLKAMQEAVVEVCKKLRGNSEHRPQLADAMASTSVVVADLEARVTALESGKLPAKK